MPTWSCYGKVIGTKYLGQVEAETEEEALEKADCLESAGHVSVCHHCSGEIGDAAIEDIIVEKD